MGKALTTNLGGNIRSINYSSKGSSTTGTRGTKIKEHGSEPGSARGKGGSRISAKQCGLTSVFLGKFHGEPIQSQTSERLRSPDGENEGRGEEATSCHVLSLQRVSSKRPCVGVALALDSKPRILPVAVILISHGCRS